MPGFAQPFSFLWWWDCSDEKMRTEWMQELEDALSLRCSSFLLHWVWLVHLTKEKNSKTWCRTWFRRFLHALQGRASVRFTDFNMFIVHNLKFPVVQKWTFFGGGVMLWAVILQWNLLLSTQPQTPVIATAYCRITEGNEEICHRNNVQYPKNRYQDVCSVCLKIKPKVKQCYTPLLFHPET